MAKKIKQTLSSGKHSLSRTLTLGWDNGFYPVSPNLIQEVLNIIDFISINQTVSPKIPSKLSFVIYQQNFYHPSTVVPTLDLYSCQVFDRKIKTIEYLNVNLGLNHYSHLRHPPTPNPKQALYFTSSFLAALRSFYNPT